MSMNGRGSGFVLVLAAVTAVAGCAKGSRPSSEVPTDASTPMPPPAVDEAAAVAVRDGSDLPPTFLSADGLADFDAEETSCGADVCGDASQPAVCGDGILNGTEQCDDGNTTPGDGCGASCRLERGFACVTQTTNPNSVCHPTKCGDGVKEGFEQCDDGNLIPYDGCSPTCTIEPKCNGMGGCTSVCGDGLVQPPEQCDDGNTISGDGCSATCTLELGTGYSCTNVTAAPAPTLDIPILYRDMLYHVTTTLPAPAPPGGGHPDFNYGPLIHGPVLGLVQTALGADGEPVLNSTGVPQTLTDATSFCWWYHDKGCGDGGANPYAKPVYLDSAGRPTTLTLTQTSSGSNVYTYTNQSFFPLDGLGWNAGTNPQLDTACGDPTTGHNFCFTSELHYVFTYAAAVAASANPAVFSFTGDDDVWAFINGVNVVDLGGVHRALSQPIVLDTARAAMLGLTDRGWYSIDLFQAERHPCASTYALTLSGFMHTVTQCQTVCGDGIAAGNEQCDNGANNVPASSNPYGRGVCTDKCTLAPYCGDGVVQSQFGEHCDGTKDCGRDCKLAKAM